VSAVWSGELFFIVGSSRSGTTWMRHLFNADDRVLVGEESYFFEDVYPALMKCYQERRHPTGIRMYVSRAELDVAAAALFRSLAGMRALRKPTATIFGEKSPSHVRRLTALKSVYPDAKVLHIVRDVRDVVASMLDASRSWAPNPQFTVRRAAQLWCRSVTAGLEGEARYQGDILRVRYEDLHERAEDTVVNSFRFIGLTCTERHASRIVDACRFERYSGGRAAGEAGGEGQFYRLGLVGGWKRNLDSEQLGEIREVAGALMHDLGYPMG